MKVSIERAERLSRSTAKEIAEELAGCVNRIASGLATVIVGYHTSKKGDSLIVAIPGGTRLIDEVRLFGIDNLDRSDHITTSVGTLMGMDAAFGYVDTEKLIGDLEIVGSAPTGYTHGLDMLPVDVCSWLEDQQVKAGNIPHLGTLDKDPFSGPSKGGFDWEDAPGAERLLVAAFAEREPGGLIEYVRGL